MFESMTQLGESLSAPKLSKSTQERLELLRLRQQKIAEPPILEPSTKQVESLSVLKNLSPIEASPKQVGFERSEINKLHKNPSGLEDYLKNIH